MLEEDREFFAELFSKPEPVAYGHHPSDRVLQAYLAGRLGDEWRFSEAFFPKLRNADLNGDWGLSEVSLHLLTCNLCCERAARLRAEELAMLAREEKLRARLPARLARSLLARLSHALARVLELGLAPQWDSSLPGRLGSLVALRLSPLAADLAVGTYIVAFTSLGFFQQRLRSGL
ncbi:MAG: hypothetical protein NUW06_02405 [Candidatus Acetothermia bacterium]|nr:hypothetical protein [Candidatus Acetothermia bacterium]MDH7504582.1 hypothetical protein [Candidatus Acetothermia bacterium]